MDDVTWAILALLLTAAGAAASWWCFTRRGAVAGLRALGWTLLVPAAWLTGLFALAGRITRAAALWGSRLVFDPTFWIGVVLAGAGVVLIVATTALKRRGLDVRPVRAKAEKPIAQSRSTPHVSTSGDDLDDIEALLRKRGIE